MFCVVDYNLTLALSPPYLSLTVNLPYLNFAQPYLSLTKTLPQPYLNITSTLPQPNPIFISILPQPYLNLTLGY